jgi:hypothetical protein
MQIDRQGRIDADPWNEGITPDQLGIDVDDLRIGHNVGEDRADGCEQRWPLTLRQRMVGEDNNRGVRRGQNDRRLRGPCGAGPECCEQHGPYKKLAEAGPAAGRID